MQQNQKQRVYTVATAHLDTCWLWDFETTVRDYIPATLKTNFDLFGKYPGYRFSFEGSYRYELMEEYYPELFETLKGYIASGQWVPCGSCYENGDVNVPSPEAMFRNILYGNGYFREKFGKPSDDIFLPDCFGFGWALPSIAAHGNLHGFSTQKLTWGGAYDIPFDLGKWYGADGKFIYASLKPGSYISSLTKVRNSMKARKKLANNLKEYDLPYTHLFHGTGDRGGAPCETSVRSVMNEAAQNGDSGVEVLSAGSYDVFTDMRRELTDEQREKLPVWNNELLLTAHGAGSYTSRTIGKRWNRRCEQLADAAERSAVAASLLAGQPYPKQTLETSWKRVVAHHFHDDITGTAFQRCYQRSWNDYVQSLNQFAEEYRAGSGAVAAMMDTSFAKGIALVVSNPLQAEDVRREAVTAQVDWPYSERNVHVLDSKGNEVPSQLNKVENGMAELVFIASVPSVGYAAYDARPVDAPYQSGLTVSETLLENDFLRVTIDSQGCISSVFNKTAQTEALRAPVRFEVIGDRLSKSFPAWEVQYKDVMRQDKIFPEVQSVRVAERGAARVSVEVVSVIELKRRVTEFKQIISLDAAAKAPRVYNEVDWHCAASMLKVAFPLSAANPKASYDIGLGVIERGANTKRRYEVPAQSWADITDTAGTHGVSIFSDSRSAWDKPDGSTLRLTAVHTPLSSFRWEASQHLMDMGQNRFSFAIYPHTGDWRNGAQETAARFLQPMTAFVTAAHGGTLGSEYSFAEVSSRDVQLRAVKRAEKTDEIIVRFQECAGYEQIGVRLRLGNGIVSARELYADEEPVGKADTSPAKVENGELVFDIGAFAPKTFALVMPPEQSAPEEAPIEIFPAETKDTCQDVGQTALKLPLDARAITANGERGLATAPGGYSYPRELIPDEILCGGVRFSVAQAPCDAVSCAGQKIGLPKGTKRLHLLACAAGSDAAAASIAFDTGGRVPFTAESFTEAIGAWDLPGLGESGYIKRDVLAYAATHAHQDGADQIGKQLYMFKYSFQVPAGASAIELPNNKNILVFAATAEDMSVPFTTASELYDRREKQPFTDTLTKSEKRRAAPSVMEKVLDKKVDRYRTIRVNVRWGGYVCQIGDIYFVIRKLLTGSR